MNLGGGRCYSTAYDTGRRSRPRGPVTQGATWPMGATACLAPAPPRRAAARRASAPLRYPGHRPRRRRSRPSPLALPARRFGLPGRKRRPPVVARRWGPTRTTRRHCHRDHPNPDRPYLRRVRHRRRHHRRNRASPTVPPTDRHHGHRRTARLNRSRGTGRHQLFKPPSRFLQDRAAKLPLDLRICSGRRNRAI